MVSGLTAFVLTNKHTDKLDVEWIKIARKCMHERGAVEVAGVRRQVSANEVMKFWHLVPVATELKVLRLKHLQNMARYPVRFTQ